MASTWPVRPELTSLYDGAVSLPPVYPDVTLATPGSFSNGGSMHQKHPPANVAFASVGESARVEVTPIATKMATTKIGTPNTIVRQLFISPH